MGPSLSHDDARGILDAEYRPPIRRGDLDGFGQGIIVAIIDGVFDQQLAVTPSELRAALARGRGYSARRAWARYALWRCPVS
ncbi:putative tfuA domain protein core [Burkholderia thailandensis]|nr:putative tfuA domain protein core [Burkholderia thailandensis]